MSTEQTHLTPAEGRGLHGALCGHYNSGDFWHTLPSKVTCGDCLSIAKRMGFLKLDEIGFDEFLTICERFLKHYPEDIFTGTSNDPGPVFIVELRNTVKKIKKVIDDKKAELWMDEMRSNYRKPR